MTEVIPFLHPEIALPTSLCYKAENSISDFPIRRRKAPERSGTRDMAGTALVVDDSMLIRHTICRFLEKRGFQVESASNGREALEIVGRTPPTLIFTDLQMPQMSGPELITELKAHPETAAIPIVVVAARHGAGETLVESRAQFVIYKDIDIDEQLDKAVLALSS
jgi:CheY-like chemotaxis protein